MLFSVPPVLPQEMLLAVLIFCLINITRMFRHLAGIMLIYLGDEMVYTPNLRDTQLTHVTSQCMYPLKPKIKVGKKKDTSCHHIELH